MKHALYIIPIAFLILRCSEVISANTDTIGQGILVETDTLDISNNGRLTEVALFKDQFYFLFETSRTNTTTRFTTMKIYDLKGNFVENVFLPKEAVSMPYSDLRVNNQRLYLKEEHQLTKKTFLLEKYVADFNEIPDTAINIYEDLEAVLILF
ncbi:hypothetical protein [uncultured Pontibacter sp.]|uniref:hypothetical protein n=1 Tax=uncultured Pontibacter sp. TaxID=453356 RepID=UPI00261181C9|nr:hypothetical protein [uncultured Pontibacter sp.]